MTGQSDQPRTGRSGQAQRGGKGPSRADVMQRKYDESTLPAKKIRTLARLTATTLLQRGWAPPMRSPAAESWTQEYQGRFGRKKHCEVTYLDSEITRYWLLGRSPNDGCREIFTTYASHRDFTSTMTEDGLTVGLRQDGEVFCANYDVFCKDDQPSRDGYRLSRIIVGEDAYTALDFPDVGQYQRRPHHSSRADSYMEDYQRCHPLAVWSKGDGVKSALKHLLPDVLS